jgi:hypothetical protein
VDPEATLNELRTLVHGYYEADRAGAIMRTELGSQYLTDNGDRMCELFTALDGWLTQGGFLPESWKGVST